MRCGKSLWTVDELQEATGGRWLVKPPKNWRPVGVGYDTSSRKLPHCICIMVTPVSWKGRKESLPRIQELAENNAACAVIQREQCTRLPKLPKSFPLLLVNNTLHALRAMARAARKRFEGKVVAVTGSVGKTTTREMLKHVAERQGGASATKWNNNNIMGVWRTLAYTPRDHAWCVVEMGFGRPVDGVRTSSLMARPHAAILTNVSKAHIDAFPPEMLEKHLSVDLIAEHKAMMFEGLEPGGVAVIGHDSPAYASVRAKAPAHASRVLRFGEAEECESRITALELGASGTKVEADIEGRRIEYSLRIPGRHMALDALGALTTVHAMGGDLEQAATDIGDFEAVIGRTNVSEFPTPDGGKGRLIDDGFNATITSVKSMLDVLSLMRPERNGRRIAVLGDVNFLGPDAVDEHARLADHAEQAGLDVIFTNGHLMKNLWDRLPESRRGTHTSTMRELYADLREHLRDLDIVAIKGGRRNGGRGDRAFLKLGKLLRDGQPAWVD